MLNFLQSFLRLKYSLVATFSETSVLTSRIYVFEQGINITSLSKKNKVFWLHSSVLDLEKQPKKLHFLRPFNSKRPFGGYFQ